MNDVNDFDAADDVRGLWNQRRAGLPLFDATHRGRVLAAVADTITAEPMRTSRRPAGPLAAAVAAAVMLLTLPSWLAVAMLPSAVRAVPVAPAPVSLGARAASVGITLPTDRSGYEAEVAHPRALPAVDQPHGAAVLRSIDVHALLDAPHLTLGETF